MRKQKQIGKWTLQGIFVGPSLGNSGFCQLADSFQGALLPISLFRWLTAVIGEVRGLDLKRASHLIKVAQLLKIRAEALNLAVAQSCAKLGSEDFCDIAPKSHPKQGRHPLLPKPSSIRD